ncbi:MAG: hypothetical protein ACKO8H_09685, partial [Microcystis panniformis]
IFLEKDRLPLTSREILCQVIIFISQYSTQLRLDKQDSSPLLSDHYLAANSSAIRDSTAL